MPQRYAVGPDPIAESVENPPMLPPKTSEVSSSASSYQTRCPGPVAESAMPPNGNNMGYNDPYMPQYMPQAEPQTMGLYGP